MIISTAALVYALGVLVIGTFAISDEIAFTNHDWVFVAMFTFGWPIVVLYVIGNKVFS